MRNEILQAPYAGPIVIGVGASAGGVEALRELFQAMPCPLGAAIVVVTHLGSRHNTLLADILARDTRLTVVDATDGVELLPDHVYVQTSDTVLLVEGNKLRVRPLHENERERNPIDVFFSSLGQQVRDRSVGIVLSGAGSDGTLGLKAIKEEGGLTVAQGHDGTGPQYEDMPASAIASGMTDLVLSTEHIGKKLFDYIRSFDALHEIAEESGRNLRNEGAATALREICDTLRRRVGHDFEGYKEKTFMRRIQRRMQVLQVSSLPEYSEKLKALPEEAGLLFRDLLIGVTSFFRDGEAFEAIEKIVIPKLFENVGASDVVRIWVPGCATGEEAYSIAMLVREYMLGLAQGPKVQVFATDIDETALSVARAGRYPASVLTDLPPQRRERFFREEAASYTVTKELRDLCIFSAHSVIRDPPFSRMDFVSCRNLLIYFNSELQDNVLPFFTMR